MSLQTQKDSSLCWVLAGPPGVGKTTLTQIIESEAQNKGKTTHVIEEFPKFLEWVDLNVNNSDLITWVGEGDRHFELNDTAYDQAFDFVAARLAQEFVEFSKVSDMQIFEAARAIKGVRYSHLYSHMTKALGPKVKFVNVQVKVKPPAELERRVLKRSEINKLAAPLPILKLYLADEKNHPTSVEDAALFNDSFIWNDEFDNSGHPTKSEKLMRGLVGQVIAMHNWV